MPTLADLLQSGRRLGIHDPKIVKTHVTATPPYHADVLGLLALGSGYRPAQDRSASPLDSIRDAIGIHPDDLPVTMPDGTPSHSLTDALTELHQSGHRVTEDWLVSVVQPLIDPYAFSMDLIGQEVIPGKRNLYRTQVRLGANPPSARRAWFLASLELRGIHGFVRQWQELDDRTTLITWQRDEPGHLWNELAGLRYEAARDGDEYADVVEQIHGILADRSRTPSSSIANRPAASQTRGEERQLRLLNQYLDVLTTLSEVQPKPHLVARLALSVHGLMRHRPSEDAYFRLRRLIENSLERFARSYRFPGTQSFEQAMRTAHAFGPILGELERLLPLPVDANFRQQHLHHYASLLAAPPTSAQAARGGAVTLGMVQPDLLQGGWSCTGFYVHAMSSLKRPPFTERAASPYMAHALARLTAANLDCIVEHDPNEPLALATDDDPNFTPIDPVRHERLTHFIDTDQLPFPMQATRPLPGIVLPVERGIAGYNCVMHAVNAKGQKDSTQLLSVWAASERLAHAFALLMAEDARLVVVNDENQVDDLSEKMDEAFEPANEREGHALKDLLRRFKKGLGR